MAPALFQAIPHTIIGIMVGAGSGSPSYTILYNVGTKSDPCLRGARQQTTDRRVAGENREPESGLWAFPERLAARDNRNVL